MTTYSCTGAGRLARASRNWHRDARDEAECRVMVYMGPVARKRGCPLAQRGCMQRLVHIVPDFEELDARCGFEAAPAALHRPLVE